MPTKGNLTKYERTTNTFIFTYMALCRLSTEGTPNHLHTPQNDKIYDQVAKSHKIRKRCKITTTLFSKMSSGSKNNASTMAELDDVDDHVRNENVDGGNDVAIDVVSLLFDSLYDIETAKIYLTSNLFAVVCLQTSIQ